MSYNHTSYDKLFYKMRQKVPTSYIFYYLIALIKVLPLFLQAHTPGYPTVPDSNISIQSYFNYVSVTYYLQNAFSSSIILVISGAALFINIILIAVLVYNLIRSKKNKEDSTDNNSSEFIFNSFTNIMFFKYIILSQFFLELDFIPLICMSSLRDPNKNYNYKIFSSDPDFNVCQGSSLIFFLIISSLNFIIDVSYNIILTFKFFDFNILSDYFWNCYASPFYSFLFLESFSQIFFVMFLNYNNDTYKLIFGLYVYFLLLVYLYKFIARNDFYSVSMRKLLIFVDYARTMVIFAQIIIQIFTLGLNQPPSDINILIFLFMEIVLAYLKHYYLNRNNSKSISLIINSNLSKLNEKNIYFSLYYLLSELRIFSDVNYKFNDKNLDTFLENYVNHIKICEDLKCPCKNYIKKVSNGSNSIKGEYNTVINFSHLGNPNIQREEYILNKFFNVLSANVSSSIKYTNGNINVNSIKDNNKGKVKYNLRVRLINAVKKLIAYKLEQIFTNLDGSFSTNFTHVTKQFIRINFFSLHFICFKSYYKTFFLFHEFMSVYNKKHGKSKRNNMIYYFYLQKRGLKDYKLNLTSSKSIKKESGHSMSMDFRKVLSHCDKFYEVEKKLVDVVCEYKNFIIYFEKGTTELETLLTKVEKFKFEYKYLTDYIRTHFKVDKISNLFVSSKIILLYKILQFEIPENLQDKLIVQTNDSELYTKTKIFSDSNYYIIANYINEQYIIKFISHELLIILEYSEDELRDQDFNILLPEKMRSIHNQVLINEIKTKNNFLKNKYKEIFLVGKRRTCILFDMNYKILINEKGEITFLCFVSVKKFKNEFKTCFACIDDNGQVLAVNREFEEYMLCSMKVLDFAKIDAEKIILQNYSNRIKEFFKDEENNGSEFFDKFDYELYLNLLFGEEFEVLKDKSESLYKKKFHRWESLKEIVKKGRYYTRYIDIYVRMRTIGIHKIFFVRFLIKGNMIIKSLSEPYNTTMSLINAVKISKREMAKLSLFKSEDNNSSSYIESNIQEKAKNENNDFLNESQSILSSAAMILKERNSKRTFKIGKNRLKDVPRSRNILFFTLLLIIMSLCSIIFTIASMILKISYLNTIDQMYSVNWNSLVLQNSIQYLSLGVLTVPQIIQNFLPLGNIDYDNSSFVNNTINIMTENIYNSKQTLYLINLVNNIYYDNELNSIITEVNNNFTFVFGNGQIYQKGVIGSNIFVDVNVYPYKEIQSFPVSSFNILNNFVTLQGNLNINFEQYLILNKINAIQNTIEPRNLLSDDDLFSYYVLENYFSEIYPYVESLKNYYKNMYESYLSNAKVNMIVLKIMEFVILFLIVLAELYFMKVGYGKAKEKMITLKTKVKSNNIESTMKKISEYLQFCNTFNIYSLYAIADFEFNQKKAEDKENSNRKQLSNSASRISEKQPTKNVNVSNFKKNADEGTNLSTIDDKGLVNKSLIKLENIKKQRQNTVYQKKDSEVSKLQDILVNSKKNIGDAATDGGDKEISKLSNKLILIKEIGLKQMRTMDDSKVVSNEFRNNHFVLKKSLSISTSELVPFDPYKLGQKKKGVLRAESAGGRRSSLGQYINNESKNEDSNQLLIHDSNTDGTPFNILDRQVIPKKKISFGGALKKFYSPDIGINDNEINNQKKTLESIQKKVENYLSNDRELPLVVRTNNIVYESIKSPIESSISLKGDSINLDNKVSVKKRDRLNHSKWKTSKSTDKANPNITFKNKITEGKLKESQEEEIGDQIEKLSYSNKGAKIILLLFVITFIILYSISVFYYFQLTERLLSLHSFSYILIDRMKFLNEILLKYETNLLTGNTQEDISYIFNSITENSKEITAMRLSNDFAYLTQTSLLDSSTQDSNACNFFSSTYSNIFNTSSADELLECNQIGDQINTNGLQASYDNIINTMRLLLGDLSQFGVLGEFVVFEKSQDPTYFNLVQAIEFTFYKYYKLLTYFILSDMNALISSIKILDSILSYASIIVNVAFSLFSLLFVILPIKSVEIIITWILNKLVKNTSLNLD